MLRRLEKLFNLPSLSASISSSSKVYSFFWAFLESFSSQLFAFVFSILLARILIPEDYGLFALAQIVAQLSQSISQGGLLQSLLRRKKIGHKESSSVFFFVMFLGLIFFGIIFCARGYLSSFFNAPRLAEILPYSSLVLLITPFQLVPQVFLTKGLHFKKIFLLQLPSLIISGAVAVLMANTGYGVFSLITQTLLNRLLSAIFLIIKTKWIPVLSFDRRYVIHHLNFSYKLILSGIIYSLTNNLYGVIIGKNFSVGQLGLYNRADAFKQLPINNITAAINKVSFPLFVSHVNSPERTSNLFFQLNSALTILVGFVLGLLIINSKILVVFILGVQWTEAAPMFKILLFTGFFYPTSSLLLSMLNAKGRSDIFLKAEIIKNVLSVIGALFFMKYGIMTLIYFQVGFSFISLFINSYFVVRIKLIDFDQLFKEIAKLFLPITLSLIIVLNLGMNESLLIGDLVIKTFIFAFSFAIALLGVKRSYLSNLKGLFQLIKKN